MTDDFLSATEVGEIANDVGPEVTTEPDPITLERKIGATCASVKLMSGTTISGDWAAGDSQAFRRLIDALVDVADGATARVDRAVRQINDMTDGARQLRNQLREALDDIDGLRDDKEALNAEGSRRLGELMAEITTLKMDLAAARTTPTLTPDAARALVERDEAKRAFAIEKQRADSAVRQVHKANEKATLELVEATSEIERLRGALTAERRRTHIADDAMWDMADRTATEADLPVWVDPFSDATCRQFQQKAIDAANAADQAFEEAKWKEGGRYLKLANMWVNLLNAAAPPETWQTEPT